MGSHRCPRIIFSITCHTQFPVSSNLCCRPKLCNLEVSGENLPSYSSRLNFQKLGSDLVGMCGIVLKAKDISKYFELMINTIFCIHVLVMRVRVWVELWTAWRFMGFKFKESIEHVVNSHNSIYFNSQPGVYWDWVDLVGSYVFAPHHWFCMHYILH